jgi:integration host factor subunit alpha
MASARSWHILRARPAYDLENSISFCRKLLHKCRIDPVIIWTMSGKTIKRADLYEAASKKARLSRYQSAILVELVLKEVADCLERGETVKLSSFGSFVVRKKGQRMGRNPKTGEQVPITPRRVVMFKPSAVLKRRINA